MVVWAHLEFVSTDNLDISWPEILTKGPSTYTGSGQAPTLYWDFSLEEEIHGPPTLLPLSSYLYSD